MTLESGSADRFAYGLGIATTAGHKIVDARFLVVDRGKQAAVVEAISEVTGVTSSGHRALTPDLATRLAGRLRQLGEAAGARTLEAAAALEQFRHPQALAGQQQTPIAAVIPDIDAPPTTAADVYLRLHLLSLRLALPRTVNLDGAFGLLNTNVWTNEGVVDLELFDVLRRDRLLQGRPLAVVMQDKFPRLLDYVAPSALRIVNPNNVRLGAHLAPGTVVMSAGAVNFNAGTLGEAMIEGRVSAGVTVGARSDIGGGASLMGTLSGGNTIAVSVGEDCLVEAMAGLGIAVGDRVRVEVGFYVKSTTPVFVVDSADWRDNTVALAYAGQTVKAAALAGLSDAIFRRNAYTGTPEVVPRGGSVWGRLNPELHNH